MTLGDTSDVESIHSLISAKGYKYKPKIFEILKKHSMQSCKICQSKRGDLKLVHQNLEEKYTTSLDFYNVKIINDIMYNEKVKVVCMFKDYLIYDDLTEFLKRSYSFPEAIIRLSKIYEFYDAYSQVFPNYITLSSRKHMYKNIERKQRLIEAQNSSNSSDSSMTEENESPGQRKLKVPTKIFNSTFMESLLKTKKKQYENMNLEGIVDSFVRNSVSHNEISSFLNDSNYSIFSKTAQRNTPQKSAIDLLAQEHRSLQAKVKKNQQKNDEKEAKPKPTKVKNHKVTGKVRTFESKKSQESISAKKKLINNFIEKKKKRGKLKVEIDLPTNEENHLKYSLITNSSDGQKIIYLKKKEGSKESSLDPEEAISKYAEDGDLPKASKKIAKKPIKNVQAFLTSTFPKEQPQ